MIAQWVAGLFGSVLLPDGLASCGRLLPVMSGLHIPVQNWETLTYWTTHTLLLKGFIYEESSYPRRILKKVQIGEA